MSKLSPWIEIEEDIGGAKYITGAMRTYVGADPGRVCNRVAFIEKTPRIRIRSGDMHPATKYDPEDHRNWAEGPFKGDGPQDPESRKWCDKALVLFGHELT